MDETQDFNFTATVNDKEVRVDGMLIMAEMALSSIQDNHNAQMIDVVRRCVRPIEVGHGLTDAEALALGLRISMRMRALGKLLAP